MNRKPTPTVNETVKSDYEMPSLVQTAEAVFSVCNSLDVNPRGINKIISVDPILFCQTQALFNYYHPSQAKMFNSISKIIVVLNACTVKNHILKLSEQTMAKLKCEVISKKRIEFERQFFVHSFSVGIASRLIAQKCGKSKTQFELYYSAGLLHDIGKYFSGDSGHCLHGRMIAEIMGLCSLLQDVIEYHHDIENYAKKCCASDIDLVCGVSLADHLIHNYIDETKDCKSSADEYSLSKLGLKEADLQGLSKDISIQAASVKEFIGEFSSC